MLINIKFLARRLVRCLAQLSILYILSLSVVSAKEEKFDFKHLQKQKWLSLETDHFKIYANLTQSGLEDVGRQLEKFRAFSRLFLETTKKSVTPVNKTRLFLTNKDKTWTSLGLSKDIVSIYQAVPGVGTIVFARTKGFFGSRSLREPNQGRAVLLNVVANEMLAAEGLKETLPNWFITGFSFYLATYSEPKNSIMLGDTSAHANRFYGLTSTFGNLLKLNLREVFRPAYSHFAKSEKDTLRRKKLHTSNAFYMRSFVAVHYFFADNERRAKMYNYLAKIEQGEDYEVAFEQTFSYDFDEFDKRIKKYITSRTMMARVYPQEAVAPLLALSGQANLTSLGAKDFFKHLIPTFAHMSDKTFKPAAKKELLQKIEEKYGKLYERPDWLKEQS